MSKKHSKQIKDNKPKLYKIKDIPKLPKNTKIFQIGFNRCATQSIEQLFLQYKISTIHHMWQSSKLCYPNYLAIIMEMNLNHPSKNIFYNDINNYQAYLDMEYVYDNNFLEFYSHFKDIDQQYPNSIYIMNIRPIKDWIFSRMKLGKIPNPKPYYKDIDDSKIKKWIHHYFEHSIKVRDYFIRTNPQKKNKLIIFSLGHSKLQDIIQQIQNISYIPLHKPSKPIEEKVDFIQSIKINSNNKKLSPSVTSLIHELIQKLGDPSQLSWWK
jgi:hypothetical protein